MGELVKLESTAWFPLSDYTPVRDGWYEVQLASGETAFAKFGTDGWTEKPMLVFTLDSVNQNVRFTDNHLGRSAR